MCTYLKSRKEYREREREREKGEWKRRIHYKYIHGHWMNVGVKYIGFAKSLSFHRHLSCGAWEQRRMRVCIRERKTLFKKLTKIKFQEKCVVITLYGCFCNIFANLFWEFESFICLFAHKSHSIVCVCIFFRFLVTFSKWK